MVKNLPANAGDIRGMGSIPGSGRSPGGGLGDRLQYSCPENPRDRGARRATVHRVTKNQTGLSTHVQSITRQYSMLISTQGKYEKSVQRGGDYGTLHFSM